MKIITIALPYANGSLHLGHLLEAIEAHVQVLFLRMVSEDVYFISGQDAHGAAITIKAKSENSSEEVFIKKILQEHLSTYNKALVNFDSFVSTHSDENLRQCLLCYDALKKNQNLLYENFNLPFDGNLGVFLSDRFIEGTCPRCAASGQYGDNCEVCGAIYSANELSDPKSRLSNTPISWKNSEHVVLSLEKSRTLLLDFLSKLDMASSIKHKLLEWFNAPLRSWDITRDGPYFGFKIPDRDNSFFYVWLDAPCGYLASLSSIVGYENLENVWNNSEIIHVIGKDIAYFHALFWPVMLDSRSLKLPSSIKVHGFVTMSGSKMSKSKGNFLLADDLLDNLPVSTVRYYLASKSNASIEDIDISAKDFTDKINTELVNKWINLGSRLLGFIHKAGDAVIADELDFDLIGDIQNVLRQVEGAYRTWDYAKVTRILAQACDMANTKVDNFKPWIVIKDSSNDAWAFSSTMIQVYIWVAYCLYPICPDLVVKALTVFDNPEINLKFNYTYGKVKKFEPLLMRLDLEKVKLFFKEND